MTTLGTDRVVVAVTTDLMDRSKIAGALAGVRVVRPGADLAGADVVLVDLTHAGEVERARAAGAEVIAFGSHVDEASLETARSQGAQAMPRSVFFRRLQDGSLLD